MKISELVTYQVDYYLKECNFTNDEKDLFLKRTKDITFEECAELMNVSISTVYRINRKIRHKMGVVDESGVAKGELQDISCR